MSERPLRVAVDARCLNTHHLRGMGKALFELVRRTSSAGIVEWHLFGDRPDQPVHSPSGPVDFTVFETPGYRLHTWEQLGFPLKVWQAGVDVVHAPATVTPWWQPVPTVVTINDTIPWTQSDPALPPGFYRDRLLPSAYGRASALVAISDCSRRDIVALWPHLAAKVHVVPLGVDERYLDATMESGRVVVGERPVTEPYLLYFGGSDPRKRLDWAFDVWRAIAATGVSLVVCGLEPALFDRVRGSIPRELSDQLFLAPFIPENEMPRLYMRAAAVLYPTLYEGFGLPALEAQAVGTPVLFSDVGSLSELKGPGAHVLPVNDIGAWISAVSGIVGSRTVTPRPDTDARQWARQFSWDVYAQRIIAVYHSITPLGRGHVRLSKRTLDEAVL